MVFISLAFFFFGGGGLLFHTILFCYANLYLIDVLWVVWGGFLLCWLLVYILLLSIFCLCFSHFEYNVSWRFSSWVYFYCNTSELLVRSVCLFYLNSLKFLSLISLLALYQILLPVVRESWWFLYCLSWTHLIVLWCIIHFFSEFSPSFYFFLEFSCISFWIILIFLQLLFCCSDLLLSFISLSILCFCHLIAVFSFLSLYFLVIFWWPVTSFGRAH